MRGCHVTSGDADGAQFDRRQRSSTALATFSAAPMQKRRRRKGSRSSEEEEVTGESVKSLR